MKTITSFRPTMILKVCNQCLLFVTYSAADLAAHVPLS